MGARDSGFTLLEILVALVILSILATSVSLSLPQSAVAERQSSLQSWQQQAEWAARRAYARGEQWAWEISPGYCQLLTWQDNQWLPGELEPAAPKTLAEGVTVLQVELDGQVLGDRGRIVFSGAPPIFRVQFGAGQQRWQLLGLANGQIQLDSLQ